MKIVSISFLTLIINIGYSQFDKNLLEQAYKENSIALLDTFFGQWQKNSEPITENEFEKLNDTLKSLYKIFSMIYNPKSLSDISEQEYYWDTIYKHIKYALIDNKTIKYLFYDEKDTLSNVPQEFFEQTGGGRTILFSDSIMNFRPYQNNDVKFVYLDENYMNTLSRFIYVQDDTSNYDKETLKRILFLNQLIAIPCTSNLFTKKCTYPILDYVLFSSNYIEAIVKIRIFSSIWNVYMERNEGEWKIRKYKFLLWNE